MSKSYLFVAILLLSGCVRTVRYEHSSFLQSQAHSDGTVTTDHHEEGQAREWRGFWPCRP